MSKHMTNPIRDRPHVCKEERAIMPKLQLTDKGGKSLEGTQQADMMEDLHSQGTG